MKKTFNLKNHMHKIAMKKKAFYDGAQGAMAGLTRAQQNCYKAKSDAGMDPQEAMESCIEEFQKPTKDSSDWNLDYISSVDKLPKAKPSAETPEAEKLKKK
jgi:hypothetical protein